MLVGMQRVGYRVRCISVAVPSRVRESAAVLWIWKASVLRIGEEIRQLKERYRSRSCSSRRRLGVRFVPPFIVSCKSSRQPCLISSNSVNT
jgi:hypothetical protein